MDDIPTLRNAVNRFMHAVSGTLQTPVIWFREKVVEPNRQTYPWYHQKFRRVPTIDECYIDDPVCYYEAELQFKRDKLVDNEIVNILRQRFEDCILYENPDHVRKCKPILEEYEKASENWFMKYGDLGAYGNVVDAYMKQKHRMVWERRHGPVGTGMKDSSVEVEAH